jgi:hypothetical protein
MVSDIFSRRPTVRQSWVVASGGAGSGARTLGGVTAPPQTQHSGAPFWAVPPEASGH